MLKSVRKSTEMLAPLVLFQLLDLKLRVSCHSTCLPPGKRLRSVSKKKELKVRRCFSYRNGRGSERSKLRLRHSVRVR
jgi:hypothetical protein